MRIIKKLAYIPDNWKFLGAVAFVIGGVVGHIDSHIKRAILEECREELRQRVLNATTADERKKNWMELTEFVRRHHL